MYRGWGVCGVGSLGCELWREKALLHREAQSQI